MSAHIWIEVYLPMTYIQRRTTHLYTKHLHIYNVVQLTFTQNTYIYTTSYNSPLHKTPTYIQLRTTHLYTKHLHLYNVVQLTFTQNTYQNHMKVMYVFDACLCLHTTIERLLPLSISKVCSNITCIFTDTYINIYTCTNKKNKEISNRFNNTIDH